MTRENTPPGGLGWFSFVPRWVKTLAPIVSASLLLLGGVAGYGIARGETNAQLKNHDMRLDKIELRLEHLYDIKAQLSELRGEVRQISKALGLKTSPSTYDTSTP
jgi:hypothetical protein